MVTLLLEDAVVTEAMLPFATSLGRVMTFLQMSQRSNCLRILLAKAGDNTVAYQFRGGSRSGASVSSEVRGASMLLCPQE